jgi:hypothetical protein
VANLHPELVAQLRDEIRAWEAGVKATPPLWKLEGYLPARR